MQIFRLETFRLEKFVFRLETTILAINWIFSNLSIYRSSFFRVACKLRRRGEQRGLTYLMKVGQQKLRMRCLRTTLFLLQCVTIWSLVGAAAVANKTYRDPLPSVYVPVGIGYFPQNVASLGDFGVFGEYLEIRGNFSACGKRTVKTLNPAIKRSASAEIRVSCEPTPDRIIVRADGTPFDFGTFPIDWNQECEMFTCSADVYPKAGQQIGLLDIDVYVPPQAQLGNATIKRVLNVPVQAGIPESSEINLCKDKRAKYSAGATGSILFTNEAKCSTTHGSLLKTLEPPDGIGKFIQIPRWLEPGQKVKNVRPFFFDGQVATTLTDKSYSRVPYSFVAPASIGSLPYKVCHTACDSGIVVKVAMKPSTYQFVISTNPTVCSGYRICIAPPNFAVDTETPNCDPGKIIDINTDSGVVVWPSKGRASLIQLKSPSHMDTVIVEFGYGVPIGGKVMPEYYVANDHREFVTSSSRGFQQDDSQKLAFIFPDEGCLKKGAGIFSKYIQYGKALTSADVEVGMLYNANMTPMEQPTNEVITTTTEFIPLDIQATTTPAAGRVIADRSSLDISNMLDTDQGSSAAYAAGKWWIWGLYVGFVLGTLITLLIGGGVFYILRRTVFSMWYRGMYKRYGCDVSATSAGVTGIGFGNTTGDVTVQGTSTTAITTGSTGNTSTGTSGSTGTTGASETSTLLDKNGTKSIAL